MHLRDQYLPRADHAFRDNGQLHHGLVRRIDDGLRRFQGRPIYPFVGCEVALLIIGVVIWIVWHVWQIRSEEREYQDEIARFGKPETLRKILGGEDPSNP
jgi:hypothetical protein